MTPILLDIGIRNWWFFDSSWDGGVVHTILGHFDLDIDFWPISRFFMSGAYLLYYS